MPLGSAQISARYHQQGAGRTVCSDSLNEHGWPEVMSKEGGGGPTCRSGRLHLARLASGGGGGGVGHR